MNGLVEKVGDTTNLYGRCPLLPMYINSLGVAESICRPNYKVFQQAPDFL
jgi:hypothetical protein